MEELLKFNVHYTYEHQNILTDDFEQYPLHGHVRVEATSMSKALDGFNQKIAKLGILQKYPTFKLETIGKHTNYGETCCAEDELEETIFLTVL